MGLTKSVDDPRRRAWLRSLYPLHRQSAVVFPNETRRSTLGVAAAARLRLSHIVGQNSEPLMSGAPENTDVPSMQPVLAIRAPHAIAALHYRAYEERLDDGTVLDWILTRLKASAPRNANVIGITDSATERRRLMNAQTGTDGVEFLHLSLRGERHLCRLLMDTFGVDRLIMAGFSHATAPGGLIRLMWQVHAGSSADLTEVIKTTFIEPLYGIEASLLEELANVALPNMPEAVLPAATMLRASRRRDVRRARDFQWIQLDARKALGLPAWRWPETIAIRTPLDVALLRRAVAALPEHDQLSGCVDAWKEGVIQAHAPRLVTNTGRKRPVAGRRVRVLYAAYLPGFTGAHQSICHLVGALDRQCYEPIALVTHEGVFTDELRRRDVPVICPERDFASAGIDGFRYAQQVIAEYRPDIVHAQHCIGQGAVSASVAARVPLIQHVRVPDVSSLRNDIHAADVSIAVSAYIRQRIAELDVDLRRVEVILNGVDVDAFRPEPTRRPGARASLDIPPDEFVVLMIARLSRNKRHDIVIKAMSALRRATGRGHLVLVGAPDGELSYKHEIETLMQSDGLAGHASMLEFVPDIRSVLHASDVMALPSEDEPLSRAVLDAMALGVPPIVSDSGGSKEVIDDGRTGCVVPCGNAVQLANVLIALVKNSPLRTAMGAAAVDKVRNSLTASHCAAKTAKIYERVLRGDYQR